MEDVKYEVIEENEESSIDKLKEPTIEDLKEFRELLEEEVYESGDWLHLYTREVSKYPLLTKEEEVELKKRINNGDREAWERFVNSNLRLVLSITKEYLNFSIERSDLVQIGNIGLMKAVERFDESLGFKFSTYATWWIRQHISRYIQETKDLIRKPVHVCEMLTDLRKASANFVKTTGKEPNVAELAKLLDISEKKVKILLEAASNPTSLDIHLLDDTNSTLGDMTSNGYSVEESVVSEMATEGIFALARDVLTDREYDILVRRAGAYTGEVETLESIGKTYGLTRERIRQIESKARRKTQNQLRRNGYSRL